MARLLLSKATLNKERKQLHSYQRFLPSLDMKRQQLRLALKKTEQQGETLQRQLSEIRQQVADTMPMLANQRLQLERLVKIYPNPSGGIVSIEISRAFKSAARIDILNQSGKVIYSKDLNSSSSIVYFLSFI